MMTISPNHITMNLSGSPRSSMKTNVIPQSRIGTKAKAKDQTQSTENHEDQSQFP